MTSHTAVTTFIIVFIVDPLSTLKARRPLIQCDFPAR